jgi:predicted small integral membrane protein
MGASRTIDRIVVWNRQDCCAERLASFWILVSETPFPQEPVPVARAGAQVWRHQHPGAAGRETRVQVGTRGRYVRVQLTGQDYLSLAELEVIGR